MALIFPSSPTNGQVYTDATTGRSFEFNSALQAWESQGGESAPVFVGSKPSNPKEGQIFYDPATDTLEVYTESTAAWEPASSAATKAKPQVLGTVYGYQDPDNSSNSYYGYDSGLVSQYNQENAITPFGSYNTAVGQNSFDSATGDNNVAVGYFSLLVATGNDNVAVGYSTLSNLSSGGSNIGIGYEAGTNISAGSNNTLIGKVQGITNLNSNIIIAAGADVGIQINENNAYGIPTATTGTIVDYGTAGYVLTSQGSTAPPQWAAAGGGNPATRTTAGILLGYMTSSTGTPGPGGDSANVFLGGHDTTALPTFDGYGNVSIGDFSMGKFATTASSNVVVGESAGFRINTASYNTIVGSLAGISSPSFEYATLIGYRAGANVNTTGNEITGVGAQALANNTSDNLFRNTAVGAYAGQYSEGQYNIHVGYKSGEYVNSNNSIFIGTSYTTTPITTVPDGTFILSRPQTTDNTILRINENNALGIPTSNGSMTVNYGLAGEVLTSQGDGAPPIWAAGGGGDTHSFVGNGDPVLTTRPDATPLQDGDVYVDEDKNYAYYYVTGLGWKPLVVSATQQREGIIYGYTTDGSGADTYNTFLGWNFRALNPTFTGTSNTIIGNFSSHRDMETASYNVTLGSSTAVTLTTGNYNTVLGYNAGSFVNDTNNATIVGADAAANRIALTETTVVGYRAMYDNIGLDPLATTALGAYAGELVDGQNNTWIGYKAGRNIITSNSTVIGSYGTGGSITEPDGIFILARPSGTDNTLLRINESNAYGVPTSNGSTTVNYGNVGEVLTSQGSGAPPSWTTVTVADANVGPAAQGVIFAYTEDSATLGNVAIGRQAANFPATAGANNTFVGAKSVPSGLTGANRNTVVGSGSGTGLTTGGTNTIVGSFQAPDITTGTGNCIIGYNNAYDLETGINNTVVGNSALNTTGPTTRNAIAIGYAALSFSTGDYNIGLGTDAGFQVVGSNNVCIGRESATSTKITDSVVLGHWEDTTTNTYTNVIAIGTNSTTNNVRLFINETGSYGIPTTAALGTTVDFGTVGQVLTSQGSTAPPIWSAGDTHSILSEGDPLTRDNGAPLQDGDVYHDNSVFSKNSETYYYFNGSWYSAHTCIDEGFGSPVGSVTGRSSGSALVENDFYIDKTNSNLYSWNGSAWQHLTAGTSTNVLATTSTFAYPAFNCWLEANTNTTSYTINFTAVAGTAKSGDVFEVVDVGGNASTNNITVNLTNYTFSDGTTSKTLNANFARLSARWSSSTSTFFFKID